MPQSLSQKIEDGTCIDQANFTAIVMYRAQEETVKPTSKIMYKRRRKSSVASTGQDDDTNESDSLTPESIPVRKRRRGESVDYLQQIYDVVRNFKKEDGGLLCDSFIRVPKRRQEPGYHDVVTNPIDMLKIQQKIRTDEYDTIEELSADFELLVNNAKVFYKRTSQEYKDACEVMDLFEATKKRVLEEKAADDDAASTDSKGKIILRVGKLARKAKEAAEKRNEKDMLDSEENSETSTNPEDELNFCEDLFTAVMTATDGDTNRPLHLVFQLLPSKKRYPKYYEVIDNPIDLRMIARKIQEGKYSSLGEMEKDLLLMTKNACTFNEPGSQIYKDAKTLKKLIQSKKIEIEHGKVSTGKTSERIRNKRFRGSQSLSAVTAALPDEDDSDDEDLAEGGDTPQWQLYKTVKDTMTPNGAYLSEPFWKLPSKRYYPDYYKEIKNPLSLGQIGKKLKNGDYGTISEVAGDMNIMFENAKKYNRPDSQLYKHAVKLQKIMQSKVKELLDFDHQYSDSDDDSADEQTTPTTKRSKVSKSPRCLTRGKYMSNIPLKRRLYALCKCLMDYKCEDGRQPMLMFMELPSKRIYPEYYTVISHPIDMMTIEQKIREEQYRSEEEILNDFKLMFSNCRKFNEESSMIYEDAVTLEKMVLDKSKELGPLHTKEKTPRVTKPRKLSNPPPLIQLQKMRTLFNTIKEYKDPRNRQLSVIFNRLPSRNDYPDYYEVIKKPMNLEIISQKLRSNTYDGLDDLVADLTLMFDNACKYNEPDSQIYKDALMLQRVTLQTKLALREDEDTVPDVRAAVQELLTSLFTAVYNHQDEEGRCFSDSFAELPEHDEVDGKKVRALSLDLIKRRLDGGNYRRLDMFQEDLFSCFERARKLSRTDSQVFEDSVELQSFFIRQRDELCRNGDLLHSPALNYSLLDLSTAVDIVRQEKLIEEQPEEESKPHDDSASREEQDGQDGPGGEDGQDTTSGTAGMADNAMSFNQQVYRIGDFVYAEPKERGMEHIILNIQRLWTNQEGQQMMFGCQYFRPNETYHVATRKFLEKEVFRSDQSIAIPLYQIRGRCAVLNIKDYLKFKPDGFEEKDVYVCESRYSTRARAFKKFKTSSWNFGTSYKLMEREELFEPKRVMNVFRDRIEKHKEEIAELEEREKVLEKEKPNVIASNQPITAAEGQVFYEQYNTPSCIIKLGDCVYLKTDSSTRPLICQVDSIWTNKSGDAMFHGPWIVLPSDIPHAPSRLFYKQEVFISTLEDTNAVANIIGKCAVLEHAEYISCRPTEIPESEVYICESLYDEVKRQVRELPDQGMKKYTHSPQVYQDEIYFFRRLINPPKVGAENPQPSPQTVIQSPQEMKQPRFQPNFESVNNSPSPLVQPKSEPDLMMEDSLDGGPPSVGSVDTPAPVTPGPTSTPISTKKKAQKSKLVTGYILYSSDIRRTVSQNNPDRSFGEVSRIVGNEWRSLPSNVKMTWEEKAARMNEVTVARAAAAGQTVDIVAGSPAANTPVNHLGHHPDLIWECLWDNCDHQFEDMQDCIEHAVQEGNGHIATFFAAIPPTEQEYQCQWRGCQRLKKSVTPFPSLQRLARHVKEVHIQKNPGKLVPAADRSKNYITSSRALPALLPPTQTPPTAPSTPSTPSSIAQALSNADSANATASGVLSQHSRNTPSPLSQNGSAVAVMKPPEPMFITVPPRPQRLLHSEAYIKYIEGLTAENRNVGTWEKQLRMCQETVPPADESKIPGAWLQNGAGNHGSVLSALWALRDFMNKDALNISKILYN
ncbi:protein polybromo-1 isoform X2 [Bemisia tabaci]|uniref:protein polybromo-1 isoform X2 n=1 Tax=Bemisia tabaci TaxID=7038 RepID=UPI003B289318